MRQRTLPITFFFIALLLLTGNVFLKLRSVRLTYYRKLEEIRMAQTPNVLFIGNSLLDERLDVYALQQGAGPQAVSLRPLNAALGGSDPHVQALLTDYSLSSHPEIKTVIIGAYDFQLTQEDHLLASDLTGNDSVGLDSRFPVPEVAFIYHFDTLERLKLRLLRAIPMAAYRVNAWKYVELLRRQMGEMGMPHAATNSDGRALDFAALEAGTAAHFDQEASEYLTDPKSFSFSYEHIFSEASRSNLRVVVVMMPMSPSHREMYYSRPSWSAYLQIARQHLEQRGFTVIDASNWMQSPSQFVDALHMSPAAATEFSTMLGSALESQSRHSPNSTR